jgi:hypothetical protein
MKWLRYQRVNSLKIQVGNTNQRNKWANTDPRIYRRWDQVPRWSKHPLLIDHTYINLGAGLIFKLYMSRGLVVTWLMGSGLVEDHHIDLCGMSGGI